uniref:RalA binding protein 1 n=2 Tax=Echinococcus granulosus TaxID=6210 RepID=A0A068WNZ9_ECHGR|nr:ralA binding protein 1 [Echinococcus granulosus]
MEIHKRSNSMAPSESPQSERFWLPSAFGADDTHMSSGDYNPGVRSDEELPESPTSLDHTTVCYSTPEEPILRMEDDAPLCSVMEGGEQSHSFKKPMSVVFRLSSGKKSRGRKVPRDSLRLPIPSVPASAMPATFPHLPPPPQVPEDTPLFPDADSRPPREKLKKAKMKELKQKKKSEESKSIKKIEEATEALEFPLRNPAKKKKRRKKISGVEVATTEPNVDKAVIGVPLETALERNPSHDGVPLPAFVRYLIDFIEEYGLAVEGIYRVPGVNSQVKQFINALNNGVEFPDIPPTSPAYLHYDETPKSVRATMLEVMDGSTTFPEVAFTPPPPPHDPAVVTSVLKHFLRSLPEPLLTTELSSSIEVICDQTADTSNGGGRRRRLAELVHRRLPRVNRYLLAWLLQHMIRVIDRAGDNKMTLSNLVIVFSPTLRMSHRLLALLLQPSPEEEAIIELTEPEATRVVGLENTSSRASPHWLFPHLAFTYRPYRAPLPPPPPSSEVGFMPLDLPDSLSELEDELFKQESLLTFTHQQIASGRASAEKDAFIWEVQHLVTKMKRKRALLELTDPEAIRAELTRHEARLERVQQELVKCKTTEGTATTSINTGFASVSNTPVTTSPEKASKPASSRLPVSQFDFVSPLSKRLSGRQKHRASAVVGGQIGSSGSLDAEFWELQQTVTMLKRRLKRCQERPPVPTHPLRELIPSESLDTEEVFDFSLRKPVTEVVARKVSAASLDSEARASLLREGTLTMDEVPTPKVESFPVEWPITPIPCVEALATVVMASSDEVGKPAAVEEARITQEEVKLGTQPSLQDHPKLDPASQYPLSICNYWAVRQQELMACQHDLKSRIHSQEAEIARIETCISQMIAAGEVREQQVRQYFHENEHLLKVDLGTSGRLQMLNPLTSPTPNEGENEDNDGDDEDDDDDESEMVATLLQLMRDNERLEALNASHIENIVSERDSCAHLKVQLRLNSYVAPPPLPSLQMNALP